MSGTEPERLRLAKKRTDERWTVIEAMGQEMAKNGSDREKRRDDWKRIRRVKSGIGLEQNRMRSESNPVELEVNDSEQDKSRLAFNGS